MIPSRRKTRETETYRCFLIKLFASYSTSLRQHKRTHSFVYQVQIFFKRVGYAYSDVNLMSFKTSLKYLSVHFFRLCRALSLRRIHNTRNLMAVHKHLPVRNDMILSVYRIYQAQCTFLKDKYFVEIRVTGGSPKDKTILSKVLSVHAVNVHKNRRRYIVS